MKGGGQKRAESLQGLRGQRYPVCYDSYLPAYHTHLSTSLWTPQSISVNSENTGVLVSTEGNQQGIS